MPPRPALKDSSAGPPPLPRAIQSAFLLVLVLQAGLFVAGPSLGLTRVGGTIATAAGCLMLGLAIHASDCGASARRFGWIAAAVILATHETGVAANVVALRVLERFLFLALVAISGVLVLRTVLRAKTVAAEEIYAAVSFYLLLGLGWATAYAFLDWLDLSPAAFSRDVIPRQAVGSYEGGQLGELLYYSYITLTTVGYGDIVPTHPITRNLAAFEALTGQLYLAVLLARLVAVRTAARP